MAADQRKNRVIAYSLVGCESRDKYRVKRKRLELLQPELKMTPNISLEWDKKRKNVVSKREQIGIVWRQLLPFVEPCPRGHKMLADVLSVPQEIFDLKNLSEVLSYEVWQSHLSENEKSFLSQFLPKEAEPDTIVRDLLAGNNFHFGNVFSRWGASLCSGELHPDTVLHEEQSLKVCRKAYHSDLLKYHNNMVVNLQMRKEKWASGSDPEVDILQNIQRSRRCIEKTLPPSEVQFYDAEENLVTTPESCSWANSEKASSSDNQNLGMVYGESRRRKDALNKISDSSSSGMKVAAIPKKGEKLHKHDIMHGNGATYMSYIKVSKELHGRVKSSIKHGGNSIQPRSLNNLLGSIGALNVQPFERFEEEERKKLHDYWLRLAYKDISEGFANWRKRQLQRQQVLGSLGEEIEQKATIKDKEEARPKDDVVELPDDCEEGIPCTISAEGVEKVQSDDLLQEQMDKEEQERERKTKYVFEEQTYNDTEMVEEDDDLPENVLIHVHNQQQIASLNGNPLINSTEIQPHGNDASAKAQGNLNHNQQQIASLTGNPLFNSAEIQPHGNGASAKAQGNLNHNQLQIASLTVNPLLSSTEIQPHGNDASAKAQGNLNHIQQQIASLTGNLIINSTEIQPRGNGASAKAQGNLNHIQQQIASLSGNLMINSTEIQLHGNDASPKAQGNLNHVYTSVSQGAPLPSACDVWPVHGSIYQSTAANNGYAPAQELSIGHTDFIREQPLQMLDREAVGLKNGSGKNILHGESVGTPFLDSETNEDRNEYLQSFFKGRDRFPCHHEPKNSGVHIHPGNALMMEMGQFPHPLGDQVHPLLPVDPRLKRPSDIYMHQDIGSSICSDGGRYTIPRPEQLPVNIHNWATANVVRLTAPSEHHLNSQKLSQNWYTSENGTREGWPNFEGAIGVNRNLSNGSNLDQSLFSVLSECNELRPITNYNSMGSAERFVQAGNYSGISQGIPASSSVLHQPPNPLNYLSGHEPKISNLGWMGFPQQNPGMHESMGKPFLRSWNQ